MIFKFDGAIAVLRKKLSGHVFGKYLQTIRFDVREIYLHLKLPFRVCPGMWRAGSQAIKESAS
jgi:hypothetical protein